MVKTSSIIIALALLIAVIFALVYMSMNREVTLPPEPAAEVPAPVPPAAPPPVPDAEMAQEAVPAEAGGARGRLTEEGAPVKAVLVPEAIYGREDSAVVADRQALDEAGGFHWDSLEPGLYAIRILRDGAEWGTFPVDVVAGFMTEGDLDLKDFGQLKGEISALGEARELYAELALVDKPDLPLYRVRVEDSGQFQLGFVPGELYIVRVVDTQGNERRIVHPIAPGETGSIRLAAPLVE